MPFYFSVKCSSCGKKYHGWNTGEICPWCGGKLIGLKEIDEEKKEEKVVEKKFLSFRKFLRRVFLEM